MNHVTHLLSSADISNFSLEVSKFCYIKKYMYRLRFDTKFLILLTFLEFLKIVLIEKVTVLMMSAKMATQALPKIKIFWNKGYDVMIYVYDVTNQILSCDLNFIIDLVMWPKFHNSSISMREVTIISILLEFDQKNWFFLRGGSSIITEASKLVLNFLSFLW